MQHDVPKLLRKMLDLTQKPRQQNLAKRLGRSFSQPKISRWLKGSLPEAPAYERIVALAHEMGVLSDVRSEDVAASLANPPGPPRVRLKGYVGAGSEAHFYALADEDYKEVEAPPGATDRTVAVEIKGRSMGPGLESWLVFYDDVRAPITEDMIGQLCVVGLADDRILVKIVRRLSNGALRLESNNTDIPPIDNVVIEWAALVTQMRRRA